jgi:hypothetical protein
LIFYREERGRLAKGLTALPAIYTSAYLLTDRFVFHYNMELLLVLGTDGTVFWGLGWEYAAQCKITITTSSQP